MLLVFSLLLSLALAGVFAADVDVCVIGAGAAGIQAAYAAEEAGLTTAIFEKNSFIGGKTKTFQYEGRTYPMGAFIDLRSSPNNIDDLIQEFSPSIPYAEIPFNNKVIANGVMEDVPGLGLIGNINMLRYIFFVRMFHQKLDDPNGLNYYVGPQYYQYFQPTKDWLQKKRML